MLVHLENITVFNNTLCKNKQKKLIMCNNNVVTAKYEVSMAEKVW